MRRVVAGPLPRGARRCAPAFPLAAVGSLAPSGEAVAHAFGQRYDLPLPLYLFLFGGGIIVAISFIVVAVASRRSPGSPLERPYPRFDLRSTAIGRGLGHPLIVALFRAIGVILFLTVLAAGFFGVQNPFRNIVPTLVWIIGWIGLAYVCALVGDAWALINPFRTLYRWLERVFKAVSGRGSLSLDRPVPRWLGVWPAVVLLIGFSWVEIIWYRNESPSAIASLLIAYTVFTFAGMFVYGRETWLGRGEVFSLVFALFARFAPTEVRVRSSACCRACHEPACRREPGDCVQCYACLACAASGDWQWNVRPWGAGLLARAPVSASMAVLVCVALAVVTFDGVRETPFWESIMFRAFHPLQPTAGARADMVMTAGLVATVFVFIAAYAACCVLMSAVVRRVAPDADPGAGTLARLFVLSLLPIAIAYHLAHYLHYLLVAGQFVIPLASDPLGIGWDLFGTAGFRTDPALVGARFSWYTALLAIVIGHVIAMYVAHRTAHGWFADRRVALASQYPLAMLMVVYTMVSLWILAQPVVEQLPHG